MCLGHPSYLQLAPAWHRVAFMWWTLNKHIFLMLCTFISFCFIYFACFVCIYVNTVCMYVIHTDTRRGHWTFWNRSC